MSRKKLVVFAGDMPGAGPHLKQLLQDSRDNLLNPQIVGIVLDEVDNNLTGPIRRMISEFDRERENRYCVCGGQSFYTENFYQGFVERFQADLSCFVGWKYPIVGLDPRTRFNSMTAINLHAVPENLTMKALQEGVDPFSVGLLPHSERQAAKLRFGIHFVMNSTNKNQVFDRGGAPVLATIEVLKPDSPESLRQKWEDTITNSILPVQTVTINRISEEKISWDGADPTTIKGQGRVIQK